MRKEYYELHNELDGSEMEAKLAVEGDVPNAHVMENLLGHFQSTDQQYGLYEPTVIHVNNLVVKYDTPKGGFSVLYRDDGSHALKRKGEKTVLSPGTIIRPEQKTEIPLSTDPLDEAAALYGVLRDKITLLGTYERQKDRILVVGPGSGRVYTINADHSTFLDGDNRDPHPPLRQLEIEYKGTLPEKVVAQSDRTKVTVDTHHEVASLRQLVIAASKDLGVIFQPTGLTKRQWLKSKLK